MRHTLLLVFLVACTDLPVDEWSGAEDDKSCHRPGGPITTVSP